MTVGAEEFETELQAADMIFDRVCKVLRLFKVRGIDGDINRAAHTTPGGVVVEIEDDLGGVCVVSVDAVTARLSARVRTTVSTRRRQRQLMARRYPQIPRQTNSNPPQNTTDK